MLWGAILQELHLTMDGEESDLPPLPRAEICKRHLRRQATFDNAGDRKANSPMPAFRPMPVEWDGGLFVGPHEGVSLMQLVPGIIGQQKIISHRVGGMQVDIRIAARRNSII